MEEIIVVIELDEGKKLLLDSLIYRSDIHSLTPIVQLENKHIRIYIYIYI